MKEQNKNKWSFFKTFTKYEEIESNFFTSNSEEILINNLDEINELLLIECQKGLLNKSKIESLLERGADLNIKDKDDKTLFYMLCNNVDMSFEILKLALEYDADLNIKNEDGRTPFYHLCYHKKTSFKIMQLALENGADLNIKDKYGGGTPFCVLCNHGEPSLEVLKLAIEKGGDLNIKVDLFGYTYTPLYQLCLNSKIKITFAMLQLALDHGADLNIENNTYIPFHFLIRRNLNFEMLLKLCIVRGNLNLTILDTCKIRCAKYEKKIENIKEYIKANESATNSISISEIPNDQDQLLKFLALQNTKNRGGIPCYEILNTNNTAIFYCFYLEGGNNISYKKEKEGVVAAMENYITLLTSNKCNRPLLNLIITKYPATFFKAAFELNLLENQTVLDLLCMRKYSKGLIGELPKPVIFMILGYALINGEKMQDEEQINI